MAALHAALQSLSPTSYTSVPRDQNEATLYLHGIFEDAQKIVDSVPLPPLGDPAITAQTQSRTRSATSTSEASCISDISSSSARSDPLDPSNVSLQNEWGKPMKLNAKDNPLGMAVYRLGGKDGKGAWFARRSVHEGLAFERWKSGLQREFPESLEVQGGPGEGNIRGIGGERRAGTMSIDGVGTVDVYHLSAQFPGPTTPRDFVTLLLTSSSALSESADLNGAAGIGKPTDRRFRESPKHFMAVSRPCDHPECPTRNGFIRGQYESVEFIREVPVNRPRKSSSVTDFNLRPRPEVADLKSKDSPGQSPGESSSLAVVEKPAREGRQRGKTISFAGSRGASAKGEKVDTPQADDENDAHAVEWIMVTRSDPGGSVPRFMVERGTPGGIVSDASKFLDWVCKKDLTKEKVSGLDKDNGQPPQGLEQPGLEAYDTNGHLAGLDDVTANIAQIRMPSVGKEIAGKGIPPVQEQHSGGMFSSVANVAYSSIENYAPQAVIDRLPGHQQSLSMSSTAVTSKEAPVPDSINSAERTPSISSTSSIGSFASAEDHFDDSKSINSQNTNTAPKEAMSPHEKELAKLQERKKQLTEKLAKARQKEMKDKEELTSREEERVRKAEEKHAREIAKQEEKYKKEISKLEAKRQKEAAKDVDRRKKAEEKDERLRLYREKDTTKQELEVVSRERDLLKEQVGALQKENTSLVVRMGKMESGKDILKEIKAESEGNRSRSSSIKRPRSLTDKSKEEMAVLKGEEEERIEISKT